VRTTALSITEKVSLSSIGPLRRAAATAAAEAGAHDELVSSVRLCVSEALANAVVHAYAGDTGAVELVVELDGDLLVVTVRDEGRGLAGHPDRMGEGGYGLEIIRKLTESVTFTSDFGRGTEICMRFARGSGGDGLPTL